MYLNREELISQLQAHGHALETLEPMASKDLDSLLTQEALELMQSFPSWLARCEDHSASSTSLQAQPAHLGKSIPKAVMEEITQNAKEPAILLGIFGNLIREYSCEYILDFLYSYTTESFYKHLAVLVQIKHHEYQEFLLDELATLYAPLLPKEEFALQMASHQRERHNTAGLIKMLHQLQKDENQGRLANLAFGKKAIVSEQSQNLQERVYNDYYESLENKLGIVDSIFRLSRAYPRERLMAMRLDELQKMSALILEQTEREKRERTLLKKFLNLFLDSIYLNDEAAFDMLCQQAIYELSEDQLETILRALSEQNPLFSQKLRDFLKAATRR